MTGSATQFLTLLAWLLLGQLGGSNRALAQSDAAPTLKVEKLAGSGVWVDPALLAELEKKTQTVPVLVWFDKQLLGSGDAYQRRREEFSAYSRSTLREAVLRTLKETHAKSWHKAEKKIQSLVNAKILSRPQGMWIVNGFSARLHIDGLNKLKKVPGVKKIFLGRGGRQANAANRPAYPSSIPSAAVETANGNGNRNEKDIFTERVRHAWYSHQLLAVRAWEEFGYQGQGVLNVVHDFNFQYTPEVASNLYSNPGEIPNNGEDDDGNGLVDDVHGYDFTADSDRIFFGTGMHGFYCVNMLCGKPLDGPQLGFGVAPQSLWAGVMGPIERTVQWAAEQGADTYSMSFSIPGLGDGRSHWRKVLEHGSLCGIYFASGAGNFGREGARNFAPVPRQMRTPEDIPAVVFASTGVHRDLSKTDFASKGPVEWKLDHYQDGTVQKPEVCAFNYQIPGPSLDGGHDKDRFVNGNSLAGPMLCGSIAILLSADPELLPWQTMEILTSTATDIAAPGVDYQTGYGLLNVYRAVKEVLRRKAVRLGQDSTPFEGRVHGDYFDATVYEKWRNEEGGQKNELFW